MDLKIRYLGLKAMLIKAREKYCSKCMYEDFCWGEHGFYEDHILSVCENLYIKVLIRKIIELKDVEFLLTFEDWEKFNSILKKVKI